MLYKYVDILYFQVNVSRTTIVLGKSEFTFDTSMHCFRKSLNALSALTINPMFQNAGKQVHP